MNTFNKKSLYAAIAGLGALGAVGTAEAVHVNPDGLGQVLIYPYYTARTRTTGLFTGSQYNSLISVVNSTASAKAVKVRFLESLDSREVLDFNLYLSAHDVWTTGVVPTSDGAGIVTADVSCTQPAIAKVGSAPSPFLNYQYSGKNADGADTSFDRTREGYVEIIEMANIVDATPTWSGVTHSKGTANTPTCKNIQCSRRQRLHDRQRRPVRLADDHQRPGDCRNRHRPDGDRSVEHASPASLVEHDDVDQAGPRQRQHPARRRTSRTARSSRRPGLEP